ncbi:sensor histidine kinase [Virgibacillus sp. 179-BFC.A HS]|uniref:Sensor histidine kinase n=1 Tax=Tigheibacillus jepli TaxID=3035914 RepID=A0ABU5CFY8_9BACI|nr:sensor histidine kinase [Virgibacillus sp. 179-BFC.A HS]MDY0405196.1 sensor histidine kinase [Virgibacillus sp. 179-BFC.A HS]
MSTFLRHVITAVIFSLLLTGLVMAVVLVAFPLKNWSMIWETSYFDIPFLVVPLGLALIAGLVLGITSAWYWQQRIKHLERKLTEIAEGQLTNEEENLYPELDKIETQVKAIQQKLQQHAQKARKSATERVTEREKFQDVIIQERNRLARELHDSVSQELFAASMMMSAMNETNPPEEPVRRQLQLVEKMIQQSQLEMRALLMHLRPVALKNKSIQEGTRQLLQELVQKVPMTITWKVEDFAVEKGIEDQLFRILQESVSNTLRHAKASELEIMLIKRDEHIILRVVDNGVGFDLEKEKTSSYGLNNMQERAEEIGGILKIISLPGQGTRLEVKVVNVGKGQDSHD